MVCTRRMVRAYVLYKFPNLPRLFHYLHATFSCSTLPDHGMTREETDSSTSEYNPESDLEQPARKLRPKPRRTSTAGSDRDREGASNASSKDVDEDVTQIPVQARQAPGNKARSWAGRMKGFTSAYRALYNTEILDANRRYDLDTLDILQPSQIGGSIWSTDEKQSLFNRLPRLGRHNVRGLAAAVGTKSEAEVHDFLLLLQQGSVEDALSRKHEFGPEDLPAAFEVPRDCEKRLDIAAKAMASKAEEWDQRVAQKRHGDTWLLTTELACELEEALNERHSQRPRTRAQDAEESDKDPAALDQDDNEQGSSEQTRLSVPSAELLHLGNWLELSRLFMESAAEQEEGWWSLVGPEENDPAIYHTTFSDFENLTIMLIKRIIPAAIFQAMSRIRALDQVKPELCVRREDVEEATRLLGLKGNWNEYWVGCARRNHIKVYADPNVSLGDNRKTFKDVYGNPRFVNLENRQRTRRGYELTYDEVEAALRTSGDWVEEPQSIPDINNTVISSSEETPYDEDLYDNSDFWTETSDSEDPEDAVIYNKDSRQQEAQRNKAEDTYLEALDRQASRAETARLWAVLNHAPKDDKKEEEGNDDLPPLPTRKRRRAADLKDWTEDTEYQSYWEMNEEPLDPKAFEEMELRGLAGRKRRKDAYARILEEQDTSDRVYNRDDEIEESDHENVGQEEEFEVEDIVSDDENVASDSDSGSPDDSSESEVLDDASTTSGQDDNEDRMELDEENDEASSSANSIDN